MEAKGLEENSLQVRQSIERMKGREGRRVCGCRSGRRDNRVGETEELLTETFLRLRVTGKLPCKVSEGDA